MRVLDPARGAVLPLLVFLLAVPAASAAQETGGSTADGRPLPSAIYNGRERQLEVRVPRLDADVRTDGLLDEPAWNEAALLTGFSQYAPVDGRPAADSTEVLVFYTDHAIHFGIRAYEPHGQVIATLADRDRLGGDDYIRILLDTFNDRRRAFVFAVNPLGVQSDGTFADGSNEDLNPDYQYESKGHVTDFGYQVEVRIPFKSIPYQQTSVQDWGINVLRVVRHSGHEQSWVPAERSAPSLLAQSGTLLELTDLKRGLVLDVNPVMTSRVTGAPHPSGDGSWRYLREDPEFGGNVRWGVTPNLSMNATVNPDFSQVEADVGQVVYDPRAALSYPEKRPFFLEGSENFQVPNSLIYTRRIVSPEAAAKLAGKIGSFNVGVLSAVDDEIPASGGNSNPVYNIVRLRRDLGEQSNFGMVYTDRMHGTNYNRMLGADTRLLLGSRYVVTGQLATSFTAAGQTSAHWKPLFDFQLTQTGRGAGFSFRLEGRHPDFHAGSGFIARPGIARANFTPRRTWFPANSAIETISFTPIFDGTWDWDRFTRGTEPNDIKANTRTTATWRGGWRTTLFTWTETFKYPAQLYTNYFIERRNEAGIVTDTVRYTGTDRLSNYGLMVNVTTPQWRDFSGSVEVLGGHDDNFDEWSSAWVSFITLNGDWRPTEQVRVNARYLEQRYHRTSDGSLVRLRTIPRVKVEYQLSRAIFLRFVGQYDAVRVAALRDDSRTNDPILIRNPDGSFRRAEAVRRDGFRADWLFSFQPNPGTVFFAGYGTSMGSEEFLKPGELERTADGFFIKLSYLLRM